MDLIAQTYPKLKSLLSRFSVARLGSIWLFLIGFATFLLFAEVAGDMFGWSPQLLRILNDVFIVSVLLASLWQIVPISRGKQKTQEGPGHESLAFLASVLDCLPVPLFCKDTQDEYRFILWNKAAEDLWNIKKEKILGKTDFDLFPSDESEHFRAADYEVMKKGHPRLIEDESITLPNGEQVYLKTIKVPIEGRYLLGVSEDITEKRVALRLLSSNHEQLTSPSHKLNEAEQIRRAMDQTSIVAVTDTKGVIVDVNDKFCEISGYSKEELIGKTHSLLKSGLHAKEFYSDLWKTIKAGKIWRGQICNRAKNGRLYWVDSTIVPTRDMNGEIVSFVALRYDITEQKALESRDREHLRNLRVIEEQIPFGFMKFERDQRITIANKRALELLEIPESERANLVYNRVRQAFPPYHVPVIPKIFSGEMAGHEMTVKLHESHVKIRLRPVTGEDGEIKSVVGTMEDVTERIRFEQELKKTNSHLQTLFDNMSEGMVVQAPDGHILQFNKSALEILGLNQDQILGRTSMGPNWRTVREDNTPFPGEDHPAIVALKTGKRQLGVIMGIYQPSGLLRWISINATPVYTTSLTEPSSVLCTFDDITGVRAAQKEAREKQIFLQSIIKNSPSVVYAKDLQGRYLFVNPTFEALHNVEESDVLGKTDYEIFAQKLADQFRESDVLVRTAKLPFQFEQAIPSTRGDRYYLSVKFPLFDGSGAVAGICGLSTEYTDEKRLTRELEATKDRIEIAMRAVHFGIWDLNIHTSVMTWDDYMHQIYGIPSNKFSGAYLDFLKMIVAEDVERFQAELKQTFDNHRDLTSQFRIYTGDGRLRTVRFEGKCFYDEQGRAVRAVGASWDVTEIVQKEIAVQKAYRELDKFFSISLDLLGISSYEGYLKRCNTAFKTTLGYEVEDLAQMKIIDLVHPDDVLQTNASMEQLRTGAPSVRFENRVRSKNGEYRIISWGAAPSREDQLIYFAARDITEEKEKGLQMIQGSRLSSLGEMSAGIAHEINNPLAIIKGKAQQLKLTLSDLSPGTIEAATAHAAIIDQTVDRIARIVKGLRTFARDAENDPFELISIKTICDETLTFCHSRFSNHAVDLQMGAVAPDLMVECRSIQVSQVILNLLNNAFDAVSTLDEKWVRLEVEDHADYIKICVTDSGHGIPKDVQEKMWHPFYTTKVVGQGTGLGLSIAAGVIKSHHGRLELDDSSPNTRFVILLPKTQSHTGQISFAS